MSATTWGSFHQRSETLGEDKRIKKDMVKNHIQFGQTAGSDGFYKAKNAAQSSTFKQGMTKDDLILVYENSNKAPTGNNMGFNELKYQKGAVSATVMNQKTSKVNTNDLSLHKQKIQEYKERMLLQKGELGYYSKSTNPTVKGSSYVPYGSATDKGYIGNRLTQADNKYRIEKQNAEVLKLRPSASS